MPAVTADPLTLPRLTRPSEVGTAWRPVHKVVTARRQVEGEGFVVRRPFPGMDLALADPFLLLDHMGAVEYGPGEAKGAPWHPHRGFETVTYMIDGAFEHEDSTGGGGLITDGATQWMTAGAGILHSELPPQEMVAKGGLFHGVQLWVNLPAAQKWTPPAYQDITAADVTLLTSDDGGDRVRPCHALAGCVPGHRLAGGLQRTGIRAVRTRLRGSPAPAARRGPAGRLRPGRRAGAAGGLRPAAGRLGRLGRAPAGRAAAARAGGPVRAVRDEHPLGDHPGRRGLPGRPPRHDPADLAAPLADGAPDRGRRARRRVAISSAPTPTRWPARCPPAWHPLAASHTEGARKHAARTRRPSVPQLAVRR